MCHPLTQVCKKMLLNTALLITIFNFTNCSKDFTAPAEAVKSADVNVQADINSKADENPQADINIQSVSDTDFVALYQRDLFDAALNTRRDLSAYNKIPGNPFTANVINPTRMQVVNDPVYGSKRTVLQMNVRTGDNAGVTQNPRAQVQTPMRYVEGNDVYVGFSVRFKSTFWTYFLTFAEFYGAPYIGSSPFRLGIQEGNLIAASEVGSKQNNLWKEPMQADVWYDFVYREKLSKDADKGLVQVWMRKQGETAYRLIVPPTNVQTITTANLLGPNYHKLACYYDKTHTFTDASKKKRVDAIEMYFAEHKVGKNFNAVAPALVR
jgi:hypothetical protein